MTHSVLQQSNRYEDSKQLCPSKYRKQVQGENHNGELFSIL